MRHFVTIFHNCHNLRQCATSPKWKQIWMWDTNNFRNQLTVLWCVLYICFTKWYKITWTCVSHQLRNEAADFIVAAALECHCSAATSQLSSSASAAFSFRSSTSALVKTFQLVVEVVLLVVVGLSASVAEPEVCWLRYKPLIMYCFLKNQEEFGSARTVYILKIVIWRQLKIEYSGTCVLYANRLGLVAMDELLKLSSYDIWWVIETILGSFSGHFHTNIGSWSS